MLEIYDIYELPDDTFLLYFKLIYLYQQEYPFLLEKLKCEIYIKGSFCGVRNTIKLVTYKDRIVVPHKFQKYILKLYQTYLLHSGLDQIEAMICQNVYWTGIIKAIHMVVTGCNTCQHTKL